MQLKALSRLAGGLLILTLNASLALAQPAAPSIVETSQACLDAVTAHLGASTTVGATLRELRDATNRSPCRDVNVAGVPLPKILDAVQAEVVSRRGTYHCPEAPLSPVCQGLNGAGARVMVMRALVGAADPGAVIRDDPTGLLNGTNSLDWSREQLTFGVAPGTGVSFLKLVLKRGQPTGSDLEAIVGPQTIWETFERNRFASSAEAAETCDGTCVESAARVIALFPLYRALQFAIQPSQAEEIKKAAALLEAKRQRWDAYHFGGGDARVQLPWELALNGVIFNATRPRDAEGHYAPFPEPPNYAITFIHPSVGLALKDAKGTDSSLVGVIEMLGFSRWSYAEDNTRSGDWGLSLIAAYQPRDNDRDWGYGVLARLPWRGVNVAWTRTDLKVGGNDDQFLISIDISKYLTGGAGDVAKLFKLEDPGK
jgi:hypothetical protein